MRNLSHLPDDVIEFVRRCLAGGESSGSGIDIQRSLPHRHVAAMLGTLRKIGLEQMLGSPPCRKRPLVAAMVVATAQHSPAKEKDRTEQTAVGLPVHSLRSLLAHLAARTNNLVRLRDAEGASHQLTEVTALQRQIFAHLALTP